MKVETCMDDSTLPTGKIALTWKAEYEPLRQSTLLHLRDLLVYQQGRLHCCEMH
nr:hypothetical protein Q903MT_gene4528 [Picea sitchensis]